MRARRYTNSAELYRRLGSCRFRMGENKYALGFHDEAHTYRLKTLELFEHLVKLDPSQQKYDSYFRDKLNQTSK